jgi:pimeloyl-ACP methyl ester carboxylesterase
VEPAQFELRRGDLALRGEELGEGPPILLAHGLTATRRYVVHGSNALPRRGYRTISYDARGHGESDPPNRSDYGYPELAGDLAAVLDERANGERAILAGHSMGAHTIAALALEQPERVADRLADALERDGIEGFVRANENPALEPRWRETVARITRERLARHRHLDAVARAVREVPRSMPFDGLDELEFLDLPTLVVASHDEVDPGHPYPVAEAWATRLPRARLVSEPKGASPLAWQGGRLSREIAAFGEEAPVRERLGGVGSGT